MLVKVKAGITKQSALLWSFSTTSNYCCSSGFTVQFNLCEYSLGSLHSSLNISLNLEWVLTTHSNFWKPKGIPAKRQLSTPYCRHHMAMSIPLQHTCGTSVDNLQTVILFERFADILGKARPETELYRFQFTCVQALKWSTTILFISQTPIPTSLHHLDKDLAQLLISRSFTLDSTEPL